MAGDEKVEDVVVDEEETITEPEKQGNEDEEKKTDEEVKFDELPDNVKKFIDRERTKASQTAREKAKREALKDPEVQKSVREQLEEEARLTAEQKAERKMAEISMRENRLDARERLQEAGIKGDELTEILDLVVSDDRDATLSKTDRFVQVFNTSVASATEAKTRELIKGAPKPKSGGSTVKEYKDMSYDERLKLKETDPARYKAESEKSRKKI